MPRKTSKYNDDFYKIPKIDLLSKKQWDYVQRRYTLSQRELEVARLVCRGLSNNEIAKKLSIAPGTAKTHIRNVYRRVHVKNKIQMLLKFVEDSKFLNK